MLSIFGHYICIYEDLSSFTEAYQTLKRIFAESNNQKIIVSSSIIWAIKSWFVSLVQHWWKLGASWVRLALAYSQSPTGIWSTMWRKKGSTFVYTLISSEMTFKLILAIGNMPLSPRSPGYSKELTDVLFGKLPFNFPKKGLGFKRFFHVYVSLT